MLQRITVLPEKPEYFDATDALAVAICHHYSSKVIMSDGGIEPMRTKKAPKKSWEQFVNANGHRVKL